jgi:hypothetical protein
VKPEARSAGTKKEDNATLFEGDDMAIPLFQSIARPSHAGASQCRLNGNPEQEVDRVEKGVFFGLVLMGQPEYG